MSHIIKVPELPESVREAAVLEWHHALGVFVQAGESLVDLETDKVVLEVAAPFSGIVTEILQPAGAIVTAGQALATLEQAVAPVSRKEDAAAPLPPKVGPAARKLAQAHDLAPQAIPHQGNRITVQDVQRQVQHQALAHPVADHTPVIEQPAAKVAQEPKVAQQHDDRPIRQVAMSRLRKRAAERLLSAQQNQAILTTFNEINMQQVMDVRRVHREEFAQKYQVKLGLMSFFVRAVVGALARYPIINAFIQNEQIVYHDYCDIGIAVSAPNGLVVPVMRNAQRLSFAELERQIADFGQRAKAHQLTLAELQGGTFTITNGGVFGSMLSTPILNPPQSAILGMHNIVERPVAENGQVVIRPVMYVALSYDHRLIDGRDAVQFLVAVKQAIEDPQRLLLGL